MLSTGREKVAIELLFQNVVATAQAEQLSEVVSDTLPVGHQPIAASDVSWNW